MNIQAVERPATNQKLDPVTFSVIWGGLLSAAAEIEGRNVEQVIADIVEREDVPR